MKPLVCAAIAVLTAAAIMVLQNVAVAALFAQLPRLTTDFSAAYLQRELSAMASQTPQTVFLGDSVLWGYRLPPERTAVSILASQGCACRNLSFKTGNPPNDYFLMRLFLANGVRPRAVVLELNQAVFNEANDYYQTLHPGIAALADAFLTPRDRASLTLPAHANANSIGASTDRVLSSVSLLYAMRTDIREALYGGPPPAPMRSLTPDLFEATYNLSPLTEKNVGVRYLKATADLLSKAHVPVLAFLTPTNHVLLHDYIDNSHYRANGAFLAGLLTRRGACVLDLDAAFPQREFIDETHLTAAGQRRLAEVLGAALARYRAGRYSRCQLGKRRPP